MPGRAKRGPPSWPGVVLCYPGVVLLYVPVWVPAPWRVQRQEALHGPVRDRAGLSKSCHEPFPADHSHFTPFPGTARPRAVLSAECGW